MKSEATWWYVYYLHTKGGNEHKQTVQHRRKRYSRIGKQAKITVLARKGVDYDPNYMRSISGTDSDFHTSRHRLRHTAEHREQVLERAVPYEHDRATRC